MYNALLIVIIDMMILYQLLKLLKYIMLQNIHWKSLQWQRATRRDFFYPDSDHHSLSQHWAHTRHSQWRIPLVLLRANIPSSGKAVGHFFCNALAGVCLQCHNPSLMIPMIFSHHLWICTYIPVYWLYVLMCRAWSRICLAAPSTMLRSWLSWGLLYIMSAAAKSWVVAIEKRKLNRLCCIILYVNINHVSFLYILVFNI